MVGQPAPVVYEWEAWNSFLIRAIWPNAWRLRADPDDAIQDVLRRLPAQTRRFMFHLNVSRSARFPKQRQGLVEALANRGISVLNAQVVDITKRHLQKACRSCGVPSVSAPRQGDPQELLIVKSNLNHGGLKERELSVSQRKLLDLPGEPDGLGAERDYCVLRRALIPEDYWRDARVSVERYVTNASNRFYRAYTFGDRLVISEATSDRPIKEMSLDVPRRNLLFRGGVSLSREDAPLPVRLVPVLTKFLREFGLDYGAVDIVVDDKELPYIVDVNSTPYWGAESQPDLVGLLRDGVVNC